MERRRMVSIGGGVVLAMFVATLQPPPASSAPTPEQKCQAAKIKLAGKYFACRTKVAAKAVSSGVAADASKCDASLEKKILSIEAKYDDSFDCGSDTQGLGAKALVRKVGIESGDIACELSGGGRAFRDDYTGSIVFVDFVSSLPSVDATLEVRNHSNIQAKARCFYATASPCAASSAFTVTVGSQSIVRWPAGMGNGATLIPPAPTQPFDGSLVCVQMDESGAPFSANSLMVSQSASSPVFGTSCARDGSGIAGYDSNNTDSTLCLGCTGNPGTDEYESCPAERAAEIENCWSLSTSFDFNCQ